MRHQRVHSWPWGLVRWETDFAAWQKPGLKVSACGIVAAGGGMGLRPGGPGGRGAVGGWRGGQQPRCASFLAFLGRAAGRRGRGGGGRAAGMQTPVGGRRKAAVSAAARRSRNGGVQVPPPFSPLPALGDAGVPGDGGGGGPGGCCGPVRGDALAGPMGQEGCSCTPGSGARLP